MEITYPDLLNNYLNFCSRREVCLKTNILDLRETNWLYPTTLLPLGIFIKAHKETIDYRPPHNPNVANYISLVTGNLDIDDIQNKSFIPIVSLPIKKDESDKILQYIYKLHNDGKDYGGENAFKYLIGELVDNMYEHSQFNNALVLAQRYDKKGFVEICFFDDGITIAGSFLNKEIKFEDSKAIVEALNGLSSKNKDRGYGLSSNLNIFIKGLCGDMLIVSGAGAVFVSKTMQKIYKLKEINSLKGTLISIRIPYPAKEIDIYEYLS